MNVSYRSYSEIRSLRSALAAAQKSLAANADAKDTLQALTALEKELGEIQDGTPTVGGLGSVNRDLARVVSMIQSADMRPASSAQETVNSACGALKTNLARWRKINAENLPALNSMLARLNIALLPSVSAAADAQCAR